MNLHAPQDLAGKLGVPLRALYAGLRDANSHYEQLELPRPGGKVRRVVNPRGPLRRLQGVFHEKVLLPGLDRSPYSHGGVRARNILTNVKAHLGQTSVFTADLADFYPSIRRERVFDLFGRLGCSGEVARLCSRLCTFNHRLEQGLATSPILADQFMIPVDERIGGACRRVGMVYTRFVDDLAIKPVRPGAERHPVSGPAHRRGARVPLQRGEGPIRAGRSRGDGDATEARKRSPRRAGAYFAGVERQLQDAARLANGEPFQGPYYTETQLRGRVSFICWVNPCRRRRLLELSRRVNWPRFRGEARVRALERVIDGVGHRPS